MRAIFFDVMDTLVRDPFHDALPGYFGLTKDELIARKHPTAWVDFERGHIDEARFFELYLPGRTVDPAAFREHLSRAYRWLPGVEALLGELRERAARPGLYALSNYPAWYAWIEDRCGLGRYLDRAFVSFETGVRKPEPEAYLAPCRALGIAPREALFVDDRTVNCEAARALGMDAIVFRGADELRRALADRALLG